MLPSRILVGKHSLIIAESKICRILKNFHRTHNNHHQISSMSSTDMPLLPHMSSAGQDHPCQTLGSQDYQLRIDSHIYNISHGCSLEEEVSMLSSLL